jgi:hypothetical protein
LVPSIARIPKNFRTLRSRAIIAYKVSKELPETVALLAVVDDKLADGRMLTRLYCVGETCYAGFEIAHFENPCPSHDNVTIATLSPVASCATGRRQKLTRRL